MAFDPPFCFIPIAATSCRINTRNAVAYANYCKRQRIIFNRPMQDFAILIIFQPDFFPFLVFSQVSTSNSAMPFVAYLVCTLANMLAILWMSPKSSHPVSRCPCLYIWQAPLCSSVLLLIVFSLKCTVKLYYITQFVVCVHILFLSLPVFRRGPWE